MRFYMCWLHDVFNPWNELLYSLKNITPAYVSEHTEMERVLVRWKSVHTLSIRLDATLHWNHNIYIPEPCLRIGAQMLVRLEQVVFHPNLERHWELLSTISESRNSPTRLRRVGGRGKGLRYILPPSKFLRTTRLRSCGIWDGPGSVFLACGFLSRLGASLAKASSGDSTHCLGKVTVAPYFTPDEVFLPSKAERNLIIWHVFCCTFQPDLKGTWLR